MKECITTIITVHIIISVCYTYIIIITHTSSNYNYLSGSYAIDKACLLKSFHACCHTDLPTFIYYLMHYRSTLLWVIIVRQFLIFFSDLEIKSHIVSEGFYLNSEKNSHWINHGGTEMTSNTTQGDSVSLDSGFSFSAGDPRFSSPVKGSVSGN